MAIEKTIDKYLNEDEEDKVLKEIKYKTIDVCSACNFYNSHSENCEEPYNKKIAFKITNMGGGFPVDLNGHCPRFKK